MLPRQLPFLFSMCGYTVSFIFSLHWLPLLTPPMCFEICFLSLSLTCFYGGFTHIPISVLFSSMNTYRLAWASALADLTWQ